MNNSETLNAKQYFYNKDYINALKLFKQEENNYASGLCYLLLKNKEKAKEYWEKNKKNSPASQWGLIILNLIELNLKELPTFFQTRAFLENILFVPLSFPKFFLLFLDFFL